LLVLKGNYRADRKEEDYRMRKRKKHNIPALTLRIFEDGKVFFAQGYGTANLAFNIPKV